jgi:hypothetical protein
MHCANGWSPLPGRSSTGNAPSLGSGIKLQPVQSGDSQYPRNPFIWR